MKYNIYNSNLVTISDAIGGKSNPLLPDGK